MKDKGNRKEIERKQAKKNIRERQQGRGHKESLCRCVHEYYWNNNKNDRTVTHGFRYMNKKTTSKIRTKNKKRNNQRRK